jgi:hypothetical protein
MSQPANDKLSSSFRHKVFLYYAGTNVLPCSADFIATHYISALVRGRSFDADKGPVLPGCDKFGPEASPREIIATHTRASRPEVRNEELLEIVEQGLASAEREITKPSSDVFGWRYQGAASCC